MGQGYSFDLRVRIIGAIARGNSCRAAARRFGVSPSTSIRLAWRKARTASLEPARQGRPPGGGKLATHADLLIGWVKAKCCITMPELAAKLEAARGVTVHPTSLSRFLIAHGFSVKKTLLASEAGRSDVARDRQIWRDNRQPRMREEPDRLVFIDETATTTKMIRLRGRALRGQRLKAWAPLDHWGTQTFIAALRATA
jgi:transposase